MTSFFHWDGRFFSQRFNRRAEPASADFSRLRASAKANAGSATLQQRKCKKTDLEIVFSASISHPNSPDTETAPPNQERTHETNCRHLRMCHLKRECCVQVPIYGYR